ncbi:MAG: 3-isopropylmalate dehydratase small subunit [Allomuricauda sp.]|nr:MAG: 3-isopropylmalate dehydratase small subunit [Allomuricauda sp.]
MEKFTKLVSRAIPLPIENVDTDQIIPARFLKATSKAGFGENLFRDWRFHKDGSSKEDFILNNSNYSGKILVAGENFGCGSSREHAAWALEDYGFKVIISSYFADIFRGNALNNGILPIKIEKEKLTLLLQHLDQNPNAEIEVDLEHQTLSLAEIDLKETFEIDPYKKMCLINGYDDIDFLLSKKEAIAQFEMQ